MCILEGWPGGFSCAGQGHRPFRKAVSPARVAAGRRGWPRKDILSHHRSAMGKQQRPPPRSLPRKVDLVSRGLDLAAWDVLGVGMGSHPSLKYRTNV